MTASKNKRKRRSTHHGNSPLPPPTNAREQMQRKYYTMRCQSFQGIVGNNDERMVFMQSVLEELYCGNIRPDARVYGQESPFVEAARLKSKNLEKLMATLDNSEKELFEKYCDAQGEIEEIARYDAFTYALKFGILLMTEVFMGRGAITGESPLT